MTDEGVGGPGGGDPRSDQDKQPKVWVHGSVAQELSARELDALFPTGVPRPLTAEAVLAAMSEAEIPPSAYLPHPGTGFVGVRDLNDHWTQDEALFPQHAPSKWIVTEEEW